MKKRGRPSNAERAAREVAKPAETTHNGDRDHQPEPKDEPMQVPALLQPIDEAKAARDKAQAYALRIWSGQSESLGRGDRVRRVQTALEGHGMSMDGVKLPGDEADDDWTEEDEQPVTWRKAAA